MKRDPRANRRQLSIGSFLTGGALVGSIAFAGCATIDDPSNTLAGSHSAASGGDGGASSVPGATGGSQASAGEGTGGTSGPVAPITCPEDTGYCGGACVSLDTTANCGSCNNICPAGSQCNTGACECLDGALLCGGICLDPQTDAANCGSCGNNCGPGGSCDGGSCLCGTGYEDCDSDGSCIDLSSSVAHCGGCGTPCGPGFDCSGGNCSCAVGLTVCTGTPDSCVDLESDANNCGSCGNACGAGLFCGGGECVTGPCDGVAACDGLTPRAMVAAGADELKGEPLGADKSCWETQQTRTGMKCWESGGRQMQVNGLTIPCDTASHALPAPRGGGYCVSVEAGGNDWAGFGIGSY